MWSDKETDEDLLGFQVHAMLLKQVIMNDYNLPVTIGLYGEWGSGKSSILKMLMNDLKKDDDTIVIYFDGWVFEGYDDAKSALMGDIVSQLISNEKFGEKIKDEGKRLLKSINWMRTLQWSCKNLIVPGTIAYATGGTSIVPFLISKFQENKGKLEDILSKEKAIDTLNEWTKTKAPEPSFGAVREFKGHFEELINKTGKKRLVVLIDDLDRCSPKRIIENLEAIKLFLNVDNTAFVIGAAEDIVANAVQSEYSKFMAEADKTAIGQLYMEKLIQIPYKLPKLNSNEVETYISLLYCKSELTPESFKKVYDDYKSFIAKEKFMAYGWDNISNKLEGEEKAKIQVTVTFITQLAKMISQCMKSNPRLIKRFLNAFELRSSLLEIGTESDIKQKQALIKLMILETDHKAQFDQLYGWCTQVPGCPEELIEVEKCASQTAEYTDNIKAWNEPSITKLITLDPKFSEVNLLDLFWVSRDKLSDVIDGVSLMSHKVRSLFNDMHESPTENIMKQTYIPRVKSLTATEKIDFFKLLDDNLLLKPADRSCYNMYYYCITEDIDGSYSYFLTLLSRMNVESIPLSMGNKIKAIWERYSKDEQLVSKLSKNEKLISKINETR